MLLTIIVHGRHDNYFGNFPWRIQTVLNKIGRNLDNVYNEYPLLAETEIVLVDWGSRPDQKLINHITIEEATRKRLRSLYVDPDTVKSVAPLAAYSSSHAVNCAVRRSRGRHILACDSDVYWTTATNRLLFDALQLGVFAADPHGHRLDDCFFWSARRHIPTSFNQNCPDIDTIDRHIEAHGDTYSLDKPNPHRFEGATCALFATKDMWHQIRGLHEEMVHWGANDIDIHYRLRMLYRYGGDVDNFGLKFYHLEHYINRTAGGELQRATNALVMPSQPAVNGDNWGLRDQPVSDNQL